MLKGYRTTIFNVVMGLTMIASMVGGELVEIEVDQINATLDAIDAALIGIWTIGNLILRAITNSPIFKRR